MTAEDPGEVRLDMVLPIDLTAIESHEAPAPAEHSAESGRVSGVPAAKDVGIEIPGGLLGGRRLRPFASSHQEAPG
jgi:hypothetical protein